MNLTYKYKDMIKDGCRTCGNKNFNEKYMSQFNGYITEKCPWCGGVGAMRESSGGDVYVRCTSCGAFNPNKVQDECKVYPKTVDLYEMFDVEFDEKCREAAERWNNRKT